MRFVYKLSSYFSNLTFSSKNTRFLKLARYYYTRPPTTYTDARIWIHTQISLLLLLLLLQSDFRWISTFVAIPLMRSSLCCVTAVSTPLAHGVAEVTFRIITERVNSKLVVTVSDTRRTRTSFISILFYLPFRDYYILSSSLLRKWENTIAVSLSLYLF